jgi:hypothetical protein
VETRQHFAFSHAALWRIDFLFFRAAIAAIAVLLAVESAVLWATQHNLSAAVVALLSASAAGVAVFAWRKAYDLVFTSWRPRMDQLRARLEVARLVRQVNRSHRNHLAGLLRELRYIRLDMRPFWQSSPVFRRFADETAILVLRGEENPLATLVLSEALKAIGLRVWSHDRLADAFSADELKSLYESKNVAILVGKGIYDETADALARVRVFSDAQIIPISVLSASGTGLIPNSYLYEDAVEFHVGMRTYLKRAASLVRPSADPQFELRERPVPTPFR